MVIIMRMNYLYLYIGLAKIRELEIGTDMMTAK